MSCDRRLGILGICLGVAALPFTSCGTSDDGVPTEGAPDAGLTDAGLTEEGAPAPHDAGTDVRAEAPTPDAEGGAPLDAGDGGRDFSTDRNAFFGDSRCDRANVQLCEDFESGTLDKAIWSVSGDMPVIDGVQKARGSKALHIVKNGDGQSYIREKKTFPEPNNTYYGRMFVYFESLPADPMPYAHWTFIAATGTGVSGEIRVSGQASGSKSLFGVGTDNRTDANGTGDWTNSDDDPKGKPKPVPTKQWLCIEWMHKGDTNETRFYWDGAEHPSLYTSSSQHGGNQMPYVLPQFDAVWVGWQEYQSSTEKFELWIDEVAIDKERIGCVL